MIYLHTAITIAFFTAFIALAVWLFRPGSKAEYQQHGDIPLDGELNNTASFRQEEQHG